MKQGLLPWRWTPCRPHFLTIQHPLFLSLPSPPPFATAITVKPTSAPCSTLSSVVDKSTATTLTARERRQLRKENRESKPTYNWKEEVEQKLIKKRKTKYKSWTEELNLDNLADLGTQWWGLKVSRATYQDTTERMARSLALNFPDFAFKVYTPAVQVKKKLKNGTISVKEKPIFPGCVFLKCVLNKEVHDFIRECDGVGGFIGSKVGNTKKMINRPRPVSDNDMEVVYRQAKEEQTKVDRDFEEEQQREGVVDSNHEGLKEVTATLKPRRRTRKALKSLEDGPSLVRFDKSLVQGSTVRVVSGSFADFSGIIKKLDRKRGMATVQFTLFGKETLADLQANEIVAEKTEEKTDVYRFIYTHI